MKKSEKTMAVVVVVLIGIGAAAHLSRKTLATTGKAAGSSKIVSQEARGGKGNSSGRTSYRAIIVKRQPSKSLAELVNDPFVSLIREKRSNSANLSAIKLEGILWDESIPLAIINDSILREGDSIDGLTIEQIEKNKVTLIKGEESYVLEVEEKAEG